MLQDIQKGKIGCVVVKDLSRLGRGYITVGYYLEMFFPSKNVRFVSINDQFDTTDGITNRDKSAHIQSGTRIPLINLFNELVSIETKMKVEVVLDMKAQRGEFIGPRAPFGYQKSNENLNQLVLDPVAAIIVRKIFEMAASGTGVTGIVRYLNERGLPTPIQYARANGLAGNFDDGNGSWNSRSVKYILTNRAYTGMLVQGKEKRVVKATHEPLAEGMGWGRSNGQNVVRMVMMHHHYLPACYAESIDVTRASSVVYDANRLMNWLTECHVKVLIHGHKHQSFVSQVSVPVKPAGNIETKDLRHITVVGMGGTGAAGCENKFATIHFEQNEMMIQFYRLYRDETASDDVCQTVKIPCG